MYNLRRTSGEPSENLRKTFGEPSENSYFIDSLSNFLRILLEKIKSRAPSSGENLKNYYTMGRSRRTVASTLNCFFPMPDNRLYAKIIFCPASAPAATTSAQDNREYVSNLPPGNPPVS